MRVKVTKDLSVFDKRFSKKAMRNTRDQLGEMVLGDMYTYVPMAQTRMLRKGVYNSRRGVIEYNQPYAKKQFYRKAKKYTTAGTSNRWDLRAKSKHGKKWRAAVAKKLGG